MADQPSKFNCASGQKTTFNLFYPLPRDPLPKPSVLTTLGFRAFIAAETPAGLVAGGLPIGVAGCWGGNVS